MYETTQPLMPTVQNNGFAYNLAGLEPRIGDENELSKTKAFAHALLMEDSSFLSHNSLAYPFMDNQEGLVSSQTITIENIMAMSTLTRSKVFPPGNHQVL